MALLPKKTYSRHNDLTVFSDKEKENVDPFDELLSSPLKQEVQFQPLSFWGKKIRRLDSKRKSKVDCGLFKASDSDEPISPCQRKRESKAGKARTLQPKSRSRKFTDRRKNCSTGNSCVNRTKAGSSLLPSKNKIVVSTNETWKNGGRSLDINLHSNESADETLFSPKTCDSHKFTHVNRCFHKADSNTLSYLVNPELKYKKESNKSHDLSKQNNLNFKIYEDIYTSRQQLKKSNSKLLMCESREESVNDTIHLDEDVNETLNLCHLGQDNFKFVTVRRHFNYPGCISRSEESILESAELNIDPGQLGSEQKKHVNSISGKSKDVCMSAESDPNSLVYFDNGLINPTSNSSESLDKIIFNESSASDVSEVSTEIPMLGCQSQCPISNVSTPLGFDNESLDYCGNGLLSMILNYIDTVDETLCNENSSSDLSKELKVSLLRCQSQGTFSDDGTPIGFNNETLVSNNNTSTDTTISVNESLDRTVCNEYSVPDVSDQSEETSILESTFCDFMSNNVTELQLMIWELLNGKYTANAMDGVLLETSSTSDDTLSSFMDEETVINVRLKAEEGHSPLTDSGMAQDVSHSISSGVALLTDSMSELNIKNATGCGSPEPENEKLDVRQGTNHEDKNSLSLSLPNVTTKRRGVLHKRYERNVRDRLSRVALQESQKEDVEMESDQSLWTMGRASMDWNKSFSFVNPVFESTRVFDAGLVEKKRQTNRFEDSENILEETLSGLDRTYALKPGKKWLRSRSLLKQIQNGTIAGGRLESTRITGRKFESFVQEMLEIQNEKSGFFTSLADITVSNKTVIGANAECTRLPGSNSSKSVMGFENLSEKSNESAFCNETLPEKSSLNHTVKVIQQEEKPSAFRSALGLECGSSLKEDSVLEESSAISARDFILMQCGQDDVLPFEEHFNERTLENCRKIGEGVYGEVFMCSDTVIKIIPIEGAEKVNGEPQKTFAEIISEVVIASKLSNLRKGKKHRTDGFSEMKRCWCVKGKYPKYLLKLWKEYDEQGSGSENDSPVMFKDDQLYIILELANGGKDLESFVFSSSAQSLSVFIQAAFSLAVAEKAFEFEHRDLHWGNVLISETKDKFMTVYLGGVEYKIPTKGVKVCIIDFTLSRINHDGCCIFNDLSVDPSLFASEGDYQFEIYRLMLKEVKNDWSLFRPKTNLFWLHYTLDKMLKMVRYRNKKAKVHVKHLKDLKSLECIVLENKDSTDFVLGKRLTDIVNKL